MPTYAGTKKSDTLGGSTGADTLIGDKGDDTYIVNHTGDVVVETRNEGNDLVASSISYTLTDNVEALVLTGTAALDGTGNTLNNILDRKSTRLNSSHLVISYAVFCLKRK